MAILTQEQLGSIKNSFKKGAFATSLFLALMMGKPAESRASIPIDDHRIERVKLTSPEQINQIVNEFLEGVGLDTSFEGMKITLPKAVAKYVAKGIKELTDSQKEILYKILREELQSIPESERVAFCILIAGYCGVQFGPEDFKINFPNPENFSENKLVGLACTVFGNVLIEIAKGENQRPDIYVRPQQDNNYQRTPEQLEYFRNIITERFPHITDLDDQWFEEMRNDLYKFEYIISGSPDLWINAIKTREHLEKSLSMSKEQIRELIIQQKINGKIAINWIDVIIHGNLNRNGIKKCHMNTMTELCMISSLNTPLLDWQY